MIATTAMYDVKDVEGFVAGTMKRSGIRFSDDEHDELLAEGLAIMAKLARDFEPHRPGYATAGRFSGYAAAILPRRLHDAWKRLHPEHLERRNGNRRTLEYGEQPVSLYVAQHPGQVGRGRPVVEAKAGKGQALPRLVDTIEDPRPAFEDDSLVDQALRLVPPHQRMRAHLTVDLIAEGRGVDEIAAELGVGRRGVTDIRQTVASAIGYLQERQAA